MISKQHCVETQSTALSSPTSHMSTLDAPLRTVTPCSPDEALVKMRKPEEVSAEPSSPTKKRRCGKVDFGQDTTVAYIESAFELTQIEKDDRWYRPSEIATFRDSARKLCRDKLESLGGDEQNGEQKESTRGLDVYYPSRQRFSKRFIQHVLEAYYVRCVGNDEHVALLAEKWSKKSLARATEMAKKDFLVAYFTDEVEYECPPENAGTLSTALLRDPKGLKIVTTPA